MLNAEQKQAVRYIEGPLLVLAGAGSGKTRVITEKIVYLIEQCGYKPSEICAVTFTNKAAHEMKSRVAKRLPMPIRRGLKVMTFHTLGLRILKKHAQAIHRRAGFSIFDSEDALQVLAGLMSGSQVRDRGFLLQVQQKISSWKNALLLPSQVSVVTGEDEIFQRFYEQYQRALETYNAVDFDDLICLVVWLFRTQAEVLTAWRLRTRYLLVDEYQDSNEAQYELVKLLVGARGALTVVGDDFQSIYAWRGAKPENLKQLQSDFPTLQVIKLEQNYRSTRTILAVANGLMTSPEQAFHKVLWSDLGVGEPIRILSCKDEQDEAEQVVVDLMSHRMRFGRQLGEYAILYRSNHQSRVFEKVLRHYGVAYRISGGQSWFAKLEVKDMMAYFRLLVNPDDDAAYLRAVSTPKRGVGEGSLEKLGAYAKERGASLFACSDHLALTQQLGDKPRQILQQFKQWIETKKSILHEGKVEQILKEVVEESAYEAHVYASTESPKQAARRMESISELTGWILKRVEAAKERDLGDILNRLMLIDMLAQHNEQAEELVQLMTLHAAKGLEFPFVYLVGMEEEILPHHACLEPPYLDEERRLTYVGITRAQKELCLSYAKQRKRAGALQATTPSRFLDELPEAHLTWFGLGQTRCPEASKAWAVSHLSGLKTLLGKEG